MRAVRALLLGLLLAAPSFAQTGELKQGVDAYWAGDYSTAVATLRKFLETADLRLDVLTARKFLAFSYLAVDEKERAVAEFERILEDDPKYDITSAEAAPSTLKVWKEVKQKKQAVLEEQGKKAKAEAMLDDAKRLFAQGQYPQAAAGFREVLKLDPTNQWAKAYLEQSSQRVSAPAGATAPAAPPTTGEAPAPPTDAGGVPPAGPEDVTANPIDTLPPAPSEKGPPPSSVVPSVWTPTNDAETKRYNEALRYNNSGLASFQGGNYAAAKNDFERAVSIYGAHPMFHYNLGLAYERMRREDLAIKEYQYTVKTDPTGYGARARRQLGLLFYRQKRWIEAARELEESLRVAPDDLDTRRYLGRAYEQAGNSDAAIQTLVLLVQQSPGSVEDRLALGNLHKNRGNTAAALAEFREVLRLSPTHPQAAALQAFIKQYQPPE